MSAAQHKSLKQTWSSLPPVFPGDLRALIQTKINHTDSSIPLLVVLDDDPTGTQTCHDISVLTQWDIKLLETTFTSDLTTRTRGFFILTNSRALHPPEAEKLIKEICTNLQKAARNTAKEFEVVLRSDSTLRGHFPLEATATEASLGQTADAWILAPFFLQGGRYVFQSIMNVSLIPLDTPLMMFIT